MNLQVPWALAWLIPVAGAIVALYFLRMRRRRMVVPAVFLWRERQDEVRANALFQRLRFSWLLLLQLLAAILACLVLARPQLMQRGLAGTVRVVVLDASASMGSTDVAPDRFGEAVRAVRSIVDSARPGDRLALIEAGPTPRVVFPLSDDSAAHRRGIESLRRFDSEANVAEALRLAASIAGSAEGGTILLLSDGAFSPVEDFSPGKAKVLFQRVGSSGQNIAVQALGSADGPEGRVLYCGLKNFGEEASVRVSIFADGNLVDAADATIAAGSTWGKSIRVGRDSQVFEARIDSGGGHLKADDVAYHVAEAGASIRALLVGPGDFFTERALVLDPRVTLDRAATLPDSEVPGSPGPSGYDITVFSGVPEAPAKSKGVLTFGRAGATTPVTVVGSMSRPGSFTQVPDPLVKGVAWDGVFVEKGQRVQPKGSGKVIVDSDQGPVVVASSGDTRRVYVAFEPLESDFPLSVSFPIFIANALDRLAPRALGRTFAVTPGRNAVLPWPSDGDVRLAGPTGEATTLRSDGGRLAVKGIDRVGRYELGQGSDRRILLASLRSEPESNISPRATVQLGGGEVARVAAPSRFADFWRPLLALLLVVLAVEWWLYGRLS